MMGEQTSRKSGVKSTGEKSSEARHGFDQMPATSPTPGASGDPQTSGQTAEETSYTHDTKRRRREDAEEGEDHG